MKHVTYGGPTGIRHLHTKFICHYYLAPGVGVLLRLFSKLAQGMDARVHVVRVCVCARARVCVCVMGLCRPCNSPLIHLRAYLKDSRVSRINSESVQAKRPW